MRRSIWTRVLAVLLIISMLAAPVSASGWNSRSRGWGSFWDRWFGGGSTIVTEPTEPEETEPVLTLVEDASTVDNGAGLRASTYVLTSEEDSAAASTASANTYALMATADDTDAQATTTTVKYFPVTMYNYDADTINDATDALDDDLTVREGLYFSDGGSGLGDYDFVTTTDLSAFVAGQYYIQNINAANNGADSWISYYVSDGLAMIYGKSMDDATLWNLEVEDGSYYLSTTVDGTKLYLTMTGKNADGDSFTTEKTAITISAFSENREGVQLSNNDYYLNQWGGSDSVWYGGWTAGDTNNGVRFYAVNNGVVSDNPTAPESVTKVTSGHELWNRWDKGSDAGDLIYTGLVQSEMVDDQIVFNVPEGGIFNDDTSVKAIYEYVGLPFVLNTETGVYSFDSDVNGAYFADTDDDGTANPASGTADKANNLYFDEGNTQGWSDMYYGDGSKNLWAPFNTNVNDTSESAIDYHFGMRADLPFSMTANGRIKSTDDESTPITFTFSGDDDVWVFIDGHLVIDLGGIHNRLDATIDFANNTITYSEENDADGDTTTGSYNDSSFATTQQLFTADSVTGVIPMTRDAFALDPDHEMQVFYLERGAGASNCRIEFNLPMNDTVIVTKDATKSWSETVANVNPDDENAGVENLSDLEQAIVNNIDFGFTLYKKTADGEYAPVANTNFYLVGRAVEGVVINQTDAYGHFYLKNGQSAKFITEIPAEGVTYYVVEDQVPDGFISPDFNFAGKATYDYTYTDGTTSGTSGTADAEDASLIPEQIIDMPTKDDDGNIISWPVNKSYEVTVKGSIEANDSIEFICSNYLDAELPNPTALAYEDIIVIDYGLSVQIDPLANDVFRGDNIEIVYFGSDNVTLTETTGTDGVVQGSWDGDQKFESGEVVHNDVTFQAQYDDAGNYIGSIRDTFTYTLTEQLTEVEVITYIICSTGTIENETTSTKLTQYDYSIGKIYIVPATVMYYEEDFSDLVTFKGTGWSLDENGKPVQEYNDTYKSPNQEPGVVGTTTDSIYGSDVAYLSDSFDSNGTSYYGDTANGAIQFYYTFTGTGTTIFARTSDTTGYVQFKLYKGTTNSGSDYEDITYRDTYWKDENTTDLDASGTLYNIPIYTQEDLDYGTYTVVATVAKAGTKTAGHDDGAGKDFWLDGIRIMQPLDKSGDADLTAKALGAYAADGESNIETVTLRNKLITDNESDADIEAGETEEKWPFAVMTDINGEVVYASEYVSIGPKNEVYLMPGQSVSFAIKYWHTDGYQMHMGMKAPFGTGTVQVGQTTYELKNATDCYYDITGLQTSVVTQTDEDGKSYYVATYTFTATDKIVSLTNIKVVGNYEFTLIENIQGGNNEGGDAVVDGPVGGN